MAHEIEIRNTQDDFQRLAIPHMDFLYNYALSLTRERESAADLLQDTFLRAFRFWDTFETGTNLRGWLCRIMKNSFINVYRKKVKEPKKVEYDDGGFDHTQTSDVFSHEGFTDEVACAIESLPDAYKTVTILNFVEELSYNEIAELLGCPVGTVRSRIHRGRMLLRNNLAGFAVENGYEH